MGRGLNVYLEVYLPFRGEHRWEGHEVLPPCTRVGALPDLLGLTEPELAILVNGRYVDEAWILADGDRVAVLRQSEGG